MNVDETTAISENGGDFRNDEDFQASFSQLGGDIGHSWYLLQHTLLGPRLKGYDYRWFFQRMGLQSKQFSGPESCRIFVVQCKALQSWWCLCELYKSELWQCDMSPCWVVSWGLDSILVI